MGYSTYSRKVGIPGGLVDYSTYSRKVSISGGIVDYSTYSKKVGIPGGLVDYSTYSRKGLQWEVDSNGKLTPRSARRPYPCEGARSPGPLRLQRGNIINTKFILFQMKLPQTLLLYYTILCYAILYYAMLYYAMLCY